MMIDKRNSFSAQIEIIGINPFVYLPQPVLDAVFEQAGKDKGKIPVKMKIDGHEFTQTLVKYAGYWRLYLNTPMRRAAGKDVGDTADFEIDYNPEKKAVPTNPKLQTALRENKEANRVFVSLAPSLQSEIIRYINSLKTEESIERNVEKAVNFLLGKERFVGRELPK